MEIARIKDGIVVNLELADEQWVQENDYVDGFRIIPCTSDNPAFIGYSWNEIDGFEQPEWKEDPLPPDPSLEQAIEVALAGE